VGVGGGSYFVWKQDRVSFQLKKHSKIKWSDSIYLAYAGFVNGAKSFVLAERTKNKPCEESLICCTVFMKPVGCEDLREFSVSNKDNSLRIHQKIY
jgi:hypothetical protein